MERSRDSPETNSAQLNEVPFLNCPPEKYLLSTDSGGSPGKAAGKVKSTHSCCGSIPPCQGYSQNDASIPRLSAK